MISLGIFGALLLCLGTCPLLGGPRYEAALVCGILGPSWVGITVAGRTFRRVGRLGEERPGRTIGLVRLGLLGQSDAASFVVVMLSLEMLLGLVVGYCEPLVGLGLLALGPGVGMLVGGLWGSAVGVALLLIRGRKSSPKAYFTLGLAAPLVSALWAVARFYQTPTVYAYDQFAGYFAGPLYDTVEYDLPRLLSFRAGTLCLLAGVLLWCRVVRLGHRGNKIKLELLVPGSRRLLLSGVFGSTALSGCVVIGLQGEALGHRGTVASIQAELGRSLRDGPCHLYYSEHVEQRSAERVAQECRGHLLQHADFFDLKNVAPVSVYLFADDAQKRRLMGAGRTNIAKPWRSEVYITDDGFPHPILGHELAHAVSGAFGRGPFKVAGSLGGWVMDPGRVEGFAEAAALRESSFGTLEQWAAAMKKVQRLPPLRQLFQLGFFGESAARSYTAAGAFVTYLRARFGAAALKKWYGGGDLPALTGKSFSELEEDWLAHLDQVEVPESVLAVARPKFSRPGLFARKCPHAADRAQSGFAEACGRDNARAAKLMDKILQWDPNQEGLKLEMPRCTAGAGELSRAAAKMSQLLAQTEVFEPHEQRRGEEFLGDLGFRLGDLESAEEHYKKAATLSLEPDHTRQLEVKLWALSQQEEIRNPLLELFVPVPGNAWSRQTLLFPLLEEPEATDLGRYLLARVALGARAFDEARSWMEAIDPEGLPLVSLRLELMQMQLVVKCESVFFGGSASALEDAYRQYRSMHDSDAARLHSGRFVERCLLASEFTD